MKLSRVSMSNFRLACSASVALESNQLIFVRGVNNDDPLASSNMAGKSTLVNAITWCTHGCDLTGKQLGASALRTDASHCEVTCSFRDLLDVVTLWRITRTRQASGSPVEMLRIETHGVKGLSSLTKYEGTPQEIQPRIDALLGERQLFLAAHVFGYDERSVPFAVDTDTNKKQLFELIVSGNEDLDNAHLAAQARRSKLRGDLVAAEATCASATQQVAACKQRSAKALERPVSDLDAIQAEITHEQDQMSLGTRTERAARDREAEMRELATKNRAAALDREAAIGAIRIESMSTRKPWEDEQVAIGLMNNAINKVALPADGSSTIVCPVCERDGFDPSDYFAKAHSEDFRLRELIKDEDARSYSRQRPVSDERVSFLGKENKASNEADKAFTIAEQAKTNKERAIANVNALTDKKLAVTKLTSDNADERAKEYRAAIFDFARATKDKQRIETELARVEFWVKGFGPKGIKAHRLSLALPRLNAIAAHYSKALFGDGTRARYAMQIKNKDGTYRDDCSLSLVSQASVILETLSAGQAMRRDIIHTLSMATLAREVGKCTLDLQIFDEVFRSIDARGIEAVMDILRERANECTVLVVEHNDELQAHFDTVLTATRTNEETSYEF